MTVTAFFLSECECAVPGALQWPGFNLSSQAVEARASANMAARVG